MRYQKLTRGGALWASVGAVLLAACNDPPPGDPVKLDLGDDAAVAGWLAELRRARIYFNHMSVGDNILAGLGALGGAGGPTLTGVDLDLVVPARLPEEAYFAHSVGGANGDPLAKLEAFARALEGAVAPAPQVALMKLCYADIGPHTDVDALLARYTTRMQQLRQRHPGTVFVHVTVPLVVQDAGWKGRVKAVTGIKDQTAQANIRRHQYNQRLRTSVAGEPLFDLALVESTWPDGRPETFARGGHRYPSLVGAYSSDGRHLNPVGQQRLARALIATLAQALAARRG